MTVPGLLGRPIERRCGQHLGPARRCRCLAWQIAESCRDARAPRARSPAAAAARCHRRRPRQERRPARPAVSRTLGGKAFASFIDKYRVSGGRRCRASTYLSVNRTERAPFYPPRLTSAWSQARAYAQWRSAVVGEIPSTAAACSPVNPAKYRSSTSSALAGS